MVCPQSPVSRPLLSLLLCAVAVTLLSSAAVHGEESPRAAPLTSYEAGPLREATLVITGKTRSVRTHLQQQLAQVEVEEVLLGEPPTRPLTVLVRGPHPASDLRKPEVTGFPAPDTVRHVFFLAIRKQGVACTFRDAFEAAGPLGAAKVQALREEIRLAQIEDPDVRAGETRAYLLAALASKRRWTRTHAVRELIVFSRARRDLIDAGVERRLRDRARAPLPREERRLLDALLKQLDRTPRVEAPADAGPRAPARTGDPWRLAWGKASEAQRTAAVSELLENPTPEDLSRVWWAFGESQAAVRRHIVRRVTELERPELLKRLLLGYAGEEDASVRGELLRAAGLLGSDAQVPWLAERAQSVRLERAALLALARIRTPAAKAALRAARTRIEKAAEGGAARRVKWIDYLLSDAFESSTLMR